MEKKKRIRLLRQPLLVDVYQRGGEKLGAGVGMVDPAPQFLGNRKSKQLEIKFLEKTKWRKL